MLIGQVLYSGLGGHATVAPTLADEFARRGHSSAFVFFGVEPLLASSQSWCEQRGVPYALVRKRPGLDLPAWRQVARELARLAPDLILCHGPSATPGVAAYAWRHRRPWFVRLTQALHRLTPQERLLSWLNYPTARGIVYLSAEYARASLRGPFALFRGRTRVIPNGLDLSRFAVAPQRPTVGRLGMLARITPLQDQATLLRAYRLLPEPAPELLVAGDGESMPRLRELASELGLRDRVRFLGTLPASAVPAFLHSLDVYCHATNGETMSTSIMQAMATGLPVVASDVPGVSNMLRHDRDGLLVPGGDPQSLAACLLRLRDDPELRARLADEARRRAQREYSVEVQAERYLQFFAAAR